MKLQPPSEHPHGLSDRDFDAIFTTDKPIIFAFHGYPWLIHRLTYRRAGHDNIHVRGYKEEGTTSPPSTCACSTISTAFILRGTSSIACRNSPEGRLRQAGNPRQAYRAQGVHLPVRRRFAGDRALDVGGDDGECASPLNGGG